MTKAELIDRINSTNPDIGENVEVTVDGRSFMTAVIDVETDGTIVVNGKYNLENIRVIRDQIKRQTRHIGINPMPSRRDNIRTVAFTLESILFALDLLPEKKDRNYDIDGRIIQEINFDPFVYINGERKTYQRDFCWSLEAKQRLISSIYEGIEIEKIVIRKRDWNELEMLAQTDPDATLAFNDIVDGKQRLSALADFVNDRISDECGNYFSEFSRIAQKNFLDQQLLTYAEMPAFSKDEDVLMQFLKMNFEGVPQSKEHLDHVRSLREEIK